MLFLTPTFLPQELLRMMGLADSVYWTNAFLVGLINALPLCALVTASLCIQFGSVACLLRTNSALVFVVFLSYAIGIILMALLVSVLVKSGTSGR